MKLIQKTRNGYDRKLIILGFIKIKYKSKNFAGGKMTHDSQKHIKTCKINISKDLVLSVIKFSKDIIKGIDLKLFNRYVKGYLDVNLFMQRINYVLTYFGDIPKEAKILEIGSGIGTSCICAKALTGANIIGVEPAPKSYKELHDCITAFKDANPSLDYEILNCGGENISLDDESVDFVYSFEVLEHVQDPYKVLAEIHRVLKKGGKAYISTCNYDSFYEGHYKRFWNPFISPERNKKNFIKKGLSPQFFDELNFITKNKIIKYVDEIGFSKCEFDPILLNLVNNVNLEVVMSKEAKSLIPTDCDIGGGEEFYSLIIDLSNPQRLISF